MSRLSLKFTSLVALVVIVVSICFTAFRIQRVEASGTIYVRANGLVEGTDKITSADNITYTFTDNIYDEIVVERSDIIIDGKGHTLQGTGAYDTNGINLNESTNVIIKNTTIKNFHYGIYLWSEHGRGGNTITGNNITDNAEGIYLWFSHYNSIVGNNLTNNGWSIDLESSSTHNTIVENNLRENSNGIMLYAYSSRNTISRNNITNSGCIFLQYESTSNNISGNTITNSGGIHLDETGNNVICANNLVNNSYGIKFFSGSFGYDIIYHNNFINNTEQVDPELTSSTIWDDSYPSGGNYWSDYTGVDTQSGRYQNQSGSDGIGDTPYSRDRYPLMNPWIPTAPISYVITVPLDFPTIQEAITVAGSGYTLFVYNGTYHERLVITKPLLVIGEDPTTTIIDGGGEGDVVRVGADNVVVQNFTIRNSGTDYASAGVSIENSGSANWRYGNALISSNIITNNAWGIQFYYSSDNIVLGNNITNNSNGIILYCSGNITISGNSIKSNSENGIQFSESGDSNVFENDIESNGDCGIGFYTTSSANTITGNNLTKNTYGVYLKQAYNNKFYHNNFVSNLDQVYVEPPLYGIVSANIWDNDYPSGGNYWSDYTGSDANDDGIGDTPYIIDANNTDRYPLVPETNMQVAPGFPINPIILSVLTAIVIVIVMAIFLVRRKKKPMEAHGSETKPQNLV